MLKPISMSVYKRNSGKSSGNEWREKELCQASDEQRKEFEARVPDPKMF